MKGATNVSNQVLKVNPEIIKKMKSYYNSSIQQKLPPSSVFVAKPTGCTITAYQSGKVLFQGKEATAEAKKWMSSSSTIPPKPKQASKKKTHAYSPPAQIASMSIVGSDEVGTGDYFGPMTVVAAYVKKEHIPLLQELGVKDSKNLKDPQIIEIAKNIKEVIPYSLLVLHNEKYNTIQQKGMSQGKMKALLHNQALTHVLNKLAPEEPDGILIDQFAEPGVYFNHVKGQSHIANKNVYFSTKAEGVHLAVAAASILARYAFVKEFEKLSQKVGVTLPKGAGPKVDEVAAKIIMKHDVSFLTKIAKVHFANTEKAKKLVNKFR
jgi:ribonuclease HIII